MFEHLMKYKKILVSGPQRSGTRICSKMIANDTKYEWIPEDNIAHDYNVAKRLLSKDGVVIQVPMQTHLVDLFDDDVLVVFMRRAVEDIITSQKRIGWSSAFKYEGGERRNYNAADIDMPIAEIKYFIWDHLQRGRIKHAMDIPYESLSKHPLWVPGNLRGNFKSHQTEVDSALT